MSRVLRPHTTLTGFTIRWLATEVAATWHLDDEVLRRYWHEERRGGENPKRFGFTEGQQLHLQSCKECRLRLTKGHSFFEQLVETAGLGVDVDDTRHLFDSR